MTLEELWFNNDRIIRIAFSCLYFKLQFDDFYAYASTYKQAKEYDYLTGD